MRLSADCRRLSTSNVTFVTFLASNSWGSLYWIRELEFLRPRRTSFMAKKDRNSKAPASTRVSVSAQPRLHQRAAEIQEYGTVSHMLPLDLEEPLRLEMTEQLNLMLADTMTLRDLYKKSHWQVAGPTFYQLHLLFDKHYEEQSEIVDTIAERVQLLGGIAIAMAADIAETTRIERPPKGREEVPVQISRLLDAHQIIIGHCRELAERANKLGDAGTNDLVVSDVLRANELQVWFLSEHLVDEPLVNADQTRLRNAS
jgi:starvation-inducible DNA-binding protein